MYVQLGLGTRLMGTCALLWSAVHSHPPNFDITLQLTPIKFWGWKTELRNHTLIPLIHLFIQFITSNLHHYHSKHMHFHNRRYYIPWLFMSSASVVQNVSRLIHVSRSVCTPGSEQSFRGMMLMKENFTCAACMK